jgi:LPS sulfotransferase NodH
MPSGSAALLLLRSQHRKRRRAAQVPVWSAPSATYIICTNPRSGSWLLSDGLTSTGVAGNPREWFNVAEEQQYRARWRMNHASDLRFAAYLRMARAASTTKNGISGTKLHYFQLAELRKRLEAMHAISGLTNAQVLSKVFPHAKYLWLRRRDKARQAISLYIASATEQWWQMDGAPPEMRPGVEVEPEYDAPAIARMEATLSRSDAKWRSYFQQTRIEPFAVAYEDLVADYPNIIRSVLTWLGLPNAETIAPPPPRLKRQSNARSDAWLVRYLADKAANGDPRQNAAPGKSGPLFAGVGKPLVRVPDLWRRWVAQAKLRNTPDSEIARVLVNNGYNRAAALAAVKEVAPA